MMYTNVYGQQMEGSDKDLRYVIITDIKLINNPIIYLSNTRSNTISTEISYV